MSSCRIRLLLALLLSICISCFAEAQHVPSSSRLSEVDKLRGLDSFSVAVSVHRKGHNDFEDRQADGRLKAFLEKRLSDVGLKIVQDDDYFPAIELIVFWDYEEDQDGNHIGFSYAEILRVDRAFAAPTGSKKPYLYAIVWERLWEDLTGKIWVQQAFEDGAEVLLKSLIEDLRASRTR